MAIRIHQAVIRGEITNEMPGIVTGRIWLVGRQTPIVLHLQGDCQRDLAGCSLAFSNPSPRFQDVGALASEQNGEVGDMTASRKARIPTVPDEVLHELIGSGQPVPHRWANCLYLEWYSETDGRVVIEAEGFTVSTSEPSWEPVDDQPGQMIDFFADSGGAADGGNGPESRPDEDADPFLKEDDDYEEEPLDEFEWEQELRDADARVDRYQEALQKYEDHVDRERILEQAMGWEAEIEDGPADEFADPSASREPDEIDGDEEWDDAEEDDEEDYIGHHYLTERTMDLALLMQKSAEMNHLLPADGNDAEQATLAARIVNSTIQLGGKLAAGLDGLANEADPEPGYVIAMLKRALVPLNEALQACADALIVHRHDPPNFVWITDSRDELFDIRTEILDLMAELREEPL